MTKIQRFSKLLTRRKCVFPVLAVVVLCTVLSLTAQGHPATGIVVDRLGNVYFSDLETVWKLDVNRKLTVFRSGVSGRHVHELFIDEQDNIYGADISYNSSTKGWPTAVWIMTPEGKFSYLLEPTEHPPRGVSIWRDHDGNNYFVDQNNHTKTHTLLLRRTPKGDVTTFAGSAYGHSDGKGTAARFSSIGGITFGPGGSLYLTDGNAVRKVSREGTVTTVANNLNFKTREDRPTLFVGAHGNLTGLAVDSNGNVFVADAGNRRLLEITTDGKVEVVYRGEPPFFPNGVFAAATGDLYVLEVGFALPSTWSGPRVRKLSQGKNEIVASVGAETKSGIKNALAEKAGASAETIMGFFYFGGPARYVFVLFSGSFVIFILVTWLRRRKVRQS